MGCIETEIINGTEKHFKYVGIMYFTNRVASSMALNQSDKPNIHT